MNSEIGSGATDLDREQTELGDLADRLVEAALNGDAAALREVVSALDDEDESIVEGDTNATDETHAALIVNYVIGKETPERALASAAFDPTTQAALAGHGLRRGRLIGKPLNINDMLDVLQEQVRRVNDKDLARGEAMLAAQAHTLDAIYNNLLQKALIQEHAQFIEMFFKLALRAQSQCRATWEAISAIQNPPIAGYVGQANIAQGGPQQVNNCTSTRWRARAREKQNPPNELLEHKEHEPDQWLDKRAADTAISSDSQLAPMGAVDGTEDSSR